MKKQIVLTQEDIIQIISNAYSVDKDKVTFGWFTDVAGYGKGEHYVQTVRATVEVPMNEGR